MRVNRGAVGVTAVSLLLSAAAIGYILRPPAAGTAALSPADQAFVASFYGAKDRLVHPHGKAATPLTAAQKAQGFAVGDDLVTRFRDAYAADPAVTVESVHLAATLLSTAATGDLTTLKVSVSISFDLEDTTKHEGFTGGQVEQHALAVRHLADGSIQAVTDQIVATG